MKVVVYLVIVLLPVAQLLRDWKFHDRRTSGHHWITRALLLVWLVAGLASTYLFWRESRDSRHMKDDLDNIVSTNRELNKNNQKLLDQVAQYQASIAARDSSITELERAAGVAARGIYSRYDFNGTIRAVSGGDMTLTTGEIHAFSTIMELNRAGKFKELATLCRAEISKAPDWLTPYLFLGVALANLGDRDKAIEMFEYVRRRAPGDPDYAKADEFLTKLRGDGRGR